MATVHRMLRIEDGAGGWYQEGAIRPDSQLSLRLLAYRLPHSPEDQEDYGLPAWSYVTASGHWLPAEEMGRLL